VAEVVTFFLDASVLLASEDRNDPQHLAAARALRPTTVATLDLTRYETANVTVRLWHDPVAARRLAMKIDGIGRDTGRPLMT
jgi:predicted nucleic acid-binding protein